MKEGRAAPAQDGDWSAALGDGTRTGSRAMGSRREGDGKGWRTRPSRGAQVCYPRRARRVHDEDMLRSHSSFGRDKVKMVRSGGNL